MSIDRVLAAQEAEKIANSYFGSPKEELGLHLTDIICFVPNTLVLASFLRKLKKLTSDIQLPDLVGYDPLGLCWFKKNSSKLSLLLLHGANPNRKFYTSKPSRNLRILSEDTENYEVCAPALLLSMRSYQTVNIRLLVTFGASLEHIKKLNLKYEDKVYLTNLSEKATDFYLQVKKEIDSIRNNEGVAQEYCIKSSIVNPKGYLEAFSYYSKAGEGFLNFAATCKRECCEAPEEAKWVEICYVKLALKDYFEALRCLEKMIENNLLVKEDIKSISLPLLLALQQNLFKYRSDENLDQHSLFEIRIIGLKVSINFLDKLEDLILQLQRLINSAEKGSAVFITNAADEQPPQAVIVNEYENLSKLGLYRRCSTINYKMASSEEKEQEKQYLLEDSVDSSCRI
jgi:hypothetical protein